MNDNHGVRLVSHDQDMQAAQEQARLGFRNFWKEVATDYNRIVPALSAAIVKCGFPVDDPSSPVEIEQMWIDNIFFDGANVCGELINEPQHVSSLSVGDAVLVPKSGISDWLCQIDQTVYGGYTIQVMREHMSDAERANHDQTWGLPFPEPGTVNVPAPPTSFDEQLVEGMLNYLQEHPEALQTVDEDGRTLLHLEVLYGRLPGARALVELGLDINVRCNRGWTALRYAEEVGWEDICSFLNSLKAER